MLEIGSKEEFIFCHILAEAFEDGFIIEDESWLLGIIENRLGISKDFHKAAYKCIRQNGLLCVDQERMTLLIDPLETDRKVHLYTSVVIEALADLKITQNEWRILNILSIILQLETEELIAVIDELEDIHVPEEIIDHFRVWMFPQERDIFEEDEEIGAIVMETGHGQAIAKPLIYTRDQYAYYWVLKTALEDRVITLEEGQILHVLEEAYGFQREYRSQITGILREGKIDSLDQRFLAQFTQQLDPVYERDIYYRILRAVIKDEDITEDEWAIMNILRSFYRISLETHEYIEDRIWNELTRDDDTDALERFKRYIGTTKDT